MYVGNALKTLLKSHKNYARYDNKYKNYRNFFIIENRDGVIKYMKRGNGLGTKIKP